MTTWYEIMSTEDAVNQRVPSAEDWHTDWEPDRLCIVKVVDHTPVQIIGCDGGEPEDNTLSRDWGWVLGELNNAYQIGYDDGRRAVN